MKVGPLLFDDIDETHPPQLRELTLMGVKHGALCYLDLRILGDQLELAYPSWPR